MIKVRAHIRGKEEFMHKKLSEICFEPLDNRRLLSLCGPDNAHLNFLENHFQIKIHHRGALFELIGDRKSIKSAEKILVTLYEISEKKILYLEDVHHLLTSFDENMEKTEKGTLIQAGRAYIRPRSKNQENYIQAIREHAMNFGIGPAGTGKTYLAVASAIEAFEKHQVQRLIFVRPAVEAGENLGFLPGDLEEKILPYLRPIYDSLYEMLGVERVTKLLSQNVIEIAPLAFMRGRTLSNAFIILDEAQNTTELQMKMFLTRIGFGSTAVITGDITQIDLNRGIKSGLIEAIEILKDIKEMSFTHFSSQDTVRHPLVQKIIDAYDRYDKEDK